MIGYVSEPSLLLVLLHVGAKRLVVGHSSRRSSRAMARRPGAALPPQGHSRRRICWIRSSCLRVISVAFTFMPWMVPLIRRSAPRHRWARRLGSWSTETSSRR